MQLTKLEILLEHRLVLSAIINNQSFNYFPVLIGIIAFIILYQGDYKIIERSLISLVIVMSISFFITAIMTKPDIINLSKWYV